MAKKQTPAEEPAAAPQKLDWPESTEKRSLFVMLNPSEAESYARQLAHTVPQIQQLEADAKASASSWKSRIDEVKCKQSRVSAIISDGREERMVKCEWAYECSGVDAASGERIFHPEKKSLFRSDTGEFIESRDITSDDRQMVADLDIDNGDEE
jgi:hypothetical protein